MEQGFSSSRKFSREKAIAAFREMAPDEDDDLADAKAPRTLIQYRSAWRVYVAWCEAENREPMPDNIARQLRDWIRHLSRSGRASTTIDSYVAAVCTVARYNGRTVERQLLVENLKAARRRGGPPRRAKPLRANVLAAVITGLDPRHPRDARDGAIMLVAFGGALRSAEVAGLDWARAGGTARGGTGFVAAEPSGIIITLLCSKSAQLTPVDIPVPDRDLPPLRQWLAAWVDAAEIRAGEPLFRPIARHGSVGSARLANEAVTRIIRARLVAHYMRDGLPELEARAVAAGFTSHSPRRGYCTSASEAGQDLAQIRRRSRHGSDETLGKYIAAAEGWDRSGLEGLWPKGDAP